MKNYLSKLFFLLSIICASNIAFAQEKSFDKLFEEGDYNLVYENYKNALKAFLQAYELDSTNSNVNYKVGLCYLNQNVGKSKAIPYLERAVKNTTKKYTEFYSKERRAPEIALFDMAKAYHHDMRFEDAITFYQNYKATLSKNNTYQLELVNLLLDQCEYGKILALKPVNVKITNIGDSINSQYPDYAAFVNGDETYMVFTSRREGSSNGARSKKDGLWFEDLYYSERKDENSPWTAAQKISDNINTVNHEASVGISTDGQTIYIYEEEKVNGQLYESKLIGNEWTKPVKLPKPINEADYWVPSASVTSDGNTIYFVSTAPGGLGERDIYRCTKMPNKEWSAPQNLGSKINTKFDEDGVFIHPDQKQLFFSSNGHRTIGGFDIFYSTLDEETNEWSEPINIGIPINTSEDDLFYVTSVDGKRAYYTSAKEGGVGEKDIYLITMPEETEKKLTVLKGFLATRNLDTLPQGTKITIFELGQTDERLIGEYAPNIMTGKYIIILPPGKTYKIVYDAPGYNSIIDEMFIDPSKSYTVLDKTFDLELTTFKTVKKVKKTFIEGTIIYVDGPDTLALKNTNLKMVDKRTGAVAAQGKTDSTGFFVFTNLDQIEDYFLSLDQVDRKFNQKSPIFLTDEDGNLKRLTFADKEGKFAFFDLPNEGNELGKILVDETLTELVGFMLNGDPWMSSVANKKIELVDANQKVVQKSTTDKYGKFRFVNLPPDQKYTVRLAEGETGLKTNSRFIIVNKQGVILNESKTDTLGFFKYETLSATANELRLLEKESSSFRIQLKGKIVKDKAATDPLINTLVYLQTEKGLVIDSTVTDQNGHFLFKNLAPDERYVVVLPNTNNTLTQAKLYLTNEDGKIIKDGPIVEKMYRFDVLPDDLAYVSTIELSETNVALKENKNKTYEMHFKYNAKAIDVTDVDFIAFMKYISYLTKSGAKATIDVESSSSKVPTKTFGSNENLSQARAKSAKQIIELELKKYNIDAKNIAFSKAKPLVQGPDYNKDFIENRKEYEKYQYIKIAVK
ncbi:MAG: hypothetical protein V4667_02660 [Bacteroidota bacterium]